MDIKQVEPGQGWLTTLNNDLATLNDNFAGLNKYQNRTYHAIGLNGWKINGGAGVIDNFPEEGMRVLWVGMDIVSVGATNAEGVLKSLEVGKIDNGFISYQIPCPNWHNATIGIAVIGWGEGGKGIYLHTMGGRIDVGDSYTATLFRVEKI